MPRPRRDPDKPKPKPSLARDAVLIARILQRHPPRKWDALLAFVRVSIDDDTEESAALTEDEEAPPPPARIPRRLA